MFWTWHVLVGLSADGTRSCRLFATFGLFRYGVEKLQQDVVGFNAFGLGFEVDDHAMPHGGRLRISTLRAEVTEPPAASDDLAVGSYAVIALEDNGCGMPPEVAARVFEPFFTTKGGAGGTGLGLSMVYGFARQSGGVVTVESQEDRGTIVRIFLPIAKQ